MSQLFGKIIVPHFCGWEGPTRASQGKTGFDTIGRITNWPKLKRLNFYQLNFILISFIVDRMNDLWNLINGWNTWQIMEQYSTFF